VIRCLWSDDNAASSLVASFGSLLNNFRKFFTAVLRASLSSGVTTGEDSTVSTRRFTRSGILLLPTLTTNPSDLATAVTLATGSNRPSTLVCQETVSFLYRAGVVRFTARTRAASRGICIRKITLAAPGRNRRVALRLENPKMTPRWIRS
jgi:hypothetical protein